ncbi:MAG: sulfur carrier protein ThiS [Alphaproteobacteria bacterium]|nr:sulfur carrier protein ThiS [Alphaproteobacteria bacterium]
MNIILNGKPAEIAGGTLAATVTELGYGEKRIATAVNGRFVPIREREALQLGEGDRVEILTPRHGG